MKEIPLASQEERDAFAKKLNEVIREFCPEGVPGKVNNLERMFQMLDILQYWTILYGRALAEGGHEARVFEATDLVNDRVERALRAGAVPMWKADGKPG
jgi:hypothetical protein